MYVCCIFDLLPEQSVDLPFPGVVYFRKGGGGLLHCSPFGGLGSSVELPMLNVVEDIASGGIERPIPVRGRELAAPMISLHERAPVLLKDAGLDQCPYRASPGEHITVCGEPTLSERAGVQPLPEVTPTSQSEDSRPGKLGHAENRALDIHAVQGTFEPRNIGVDPGPRDLCARQRELVRRQLVEGDNVGVDGPLQLQDAVHRRGVIKRLCELRCEVVGIRPFFSRPLKLGTLLGHYQKLRHRSPFGPLLDPVAFPHFSCYSSLRSATVGVVPGADLPFAKSDFA